MDIKNELNEKDYKKIIQVNINVDKIKESIKLLVESNIDYEFRTTVAPGMAKENIINIAKEIKGANKYYLQEFQDMDIIDNECKQKG
jgi:pyruvate formate lyase activating enzyme